jgi:cell division GTPase FtsZ
MTTTNNKEQVEKEEIKNDLDNDKLRKLRSKAEGSDMTPVIVEQKQKSLKFGIVGSGQAGSIIAESFSQLGYDAVVFNTAVQDLVHINLPNSNKLHLSYGLGGAGRELDIGYAAADNYRDSIRELLNKKLSDSQTFLFCTSLGGGSGAGSSEVIIDILSEFGAPIVVMAALPQSSDDAQVKSNSLITLSKMTKLLQSGKISNLIVVDNAAIESIYSDVSPVNFFKVSNKAIVDPVDAFNRLSSRSSDVKGLDPTEFSKLFIDGQGLTVYGTIKVSNYEDDTAIAEAIVENLKTSLLAKGFDLKQARYVGALFVANEKVWSKIPSSSVNYAMSMINDVCGTPRGVFKGIYTEDSNEDTVTVYSMFSGLALPSERIDQLKTEAQERMATADKKDQERNLNLNLSTGHETVNAAEAIKKKIEQKKSAFGRLHGMAVDRRK